MSAPSTTRKPGSHGSAIRSRRTLSMARRVLLEQVQARDPRACEAVLRIDAEREFLGLDKVDEG
jgi:hypothetical protein